MDVRKLEIVAQKLYRCSLRINFSGANVKDFSSHEIRLQPSVSLGAIPFI